MPFPAEMIRFGYRMVLVPGIIMCIAVASHARQLHGIDDGEISSHVFRGLGIAGEPSLYKQCAKNGYAALRLFEYTAMSPVAITRVESIDGTSRITKSTFDNQGKRHAVTRDLNPAQWQDLIDVIRVSGFWAAETDGSTWDPDGPTWLVEVCHQGIFHALRLYPEQDPRMQEIATYLAKLEN